MSTTTEIETEKPSIKTEIQDAFPADKSVITIRPARGWQFINVGELWRFRELLYFLTWRDVKVRYKQTVLGVAWAILQPAMMMVVFTLFFGRMAGMSAQTSVPYPLFVLAALLPWTFFSTAVNNAGNSVIGSERLITKIYFPRLAIPFASIGAAVFDFLVSCALLAVMMAYYQAPLSPQILLAPVIFLMVFLLASGLGTLAAALNVAYRDFRYVIPFLLQIGMFATPTIYTQPSAESSRSLEILLYANPMTSLIAAFRACVLGGDIPWGPLAVASGPVLLLFIGCCLYFRRVEDSFADIV